MNLRRVTQHLLAALAIALPPAGLAQTNSVPAFVTYQGKIVDASGTPVGNGTQVTRVVVFRVWDGPTATGAANRLYSEQQFVTISGGEFSVLIGAGTPVAGEANNAFSTFSAAVFAGPSRYLGVTVDDGDGNVANDSEGLPRSQVVATAFAFRSQVAEAIAPSGIAATAFANDSVLAVALAAGAVTSAKLANSAVGTAQLADGSVTQAKLANAAVTTVGLADAAVTNAKIAAGVLDATKLADGAVALAKLADNAVNSAKIVDGAVAAADLAAGAVDATKLADGAVTLAKTAASSIDSSKIVDGSVALANVASAAVDSTKLVAGTVGPSQLNTVLRDSVPKQRVIYNQGVSKEYVVARTKGFTLVPIDIKDLGDDVDGCRIEIISESKLYSDDWRIGTWTIFLTQPGFVNDPDYPKFIWGRSKHVGRGGIASWSFRLGQPLSSQPDQYVGAMEEYGVIIYTYYPGSQRSGEIAPFNQNQDNSVTNVNCGGPEVSFTNVSIVAGTGTLTITLNNPHAIQVGDSLKLAGIAGAGTPNTTFTVTAVPDRMSFTVALPGASGAYSSGTTMHKPTYSKFRLWVAIHADHSVRIIVNDR